MPAKNQKASEIEMNVDDGVWVRIFAEKQQKKVLLHLLFLQPRVENRYINNKYQQLIFVLLLLVDALFISPFAEWISADPKHSDQYSLQALQVQSQQREFRSTEELLSQLWVSQSEERDAWTVRCGDRDVWWLGSILFLFQDHLPHLTWQEWSRDENTYKRGTIFINLKRIYFKTFLKV